jgi:hypothetical protein
MTKQQQELRAQLAAQTAAYLANGGDCRQIQMGRVSSPVRIEMRKLVADYNRGRLRSAKVRAAA